MDIDIFQMNRNSGENRGPYDLSTRLNRPRICIFPRQNEVKFVRGFVNI